jgi:hypothetical protein
MRCNARVAFCPLLSDGKNEDLGERPLLGAKQSFVGRCLADGFFRSTAPFWEAQAFPVCRFGGRAF